MQPDACHCPLMFSTIHSVYCRPPLQPRRHDFGPRALLVEDDVRAARQQIEAVSVVVTRQLATSPGELWMVAVFRLMPSFGAGPVGDGPGVTGAGSASVRKACVFDHGPTVVGSEARTCQ